MKHIVIMRWHALLLQKPENYNADYWIRTHDVLQSFCRTAPSHMSRADADGGWLFVRAELERVS